MQGGGGGGCGRRRQCLGARRLGVRRLQQHVSMHGRSSAAARRSEGRRRVWDAACGRGARPAAPPPPNSATRLPAMNAEQCRPPANRKHRWGPRTLPVRLQRLAAPAISSLLWFLSVAKAWPAPGHCTLQLPEELQADSTSR